MSGTAGPGARAQERAARGRASVDAVLDPDRRSLVQRRTVLVLSAGTVLSGFGTGASLSVGALVLAELSGNEAISGLSSALFNAGAAVAGIPLARIAARRGRRAALVTGSGIAALGALIAIIAGAVHAWPLFAAGVALVGVSSAVSLLARFAATDLALPNDRARDLSFVVWSITIGAVIGPNLITPGEAVGRALGILPLAGVFLFALAAQVLAALVNWFGLRPDPLLAARLLPPETASTPVIASSSGESAEAGDAVAAGTDHGAATGAGSPRARWLVIVGIAMAQAIMVALMAMTPLHIMHHEGTAALVGITISMHIAGMYALSPVFGTLASRFGRPRVLWLGWALLACAVVLSYIAGPSQILVQIALTTLGLGWSAVTVAGAALLTELTPSTVRPKWQGRSDTIMSASGAVAGVLAGVVFALGDFAFLALVSAVFLVLGALATLWGRR